MKKLFIVYATILFSSCAFLESEKAQPINQHTYQQADTLESWAKQIDFVLADTNKVAKLRIYATDWNTSCLPMPTGKVLLRDVTGDAAYIYLTTSFDSLTAKISTEKERSAEAPCSWKQQFKSGITYSTNSCKASGANYKIETPCSDKKVLIALVDIIFQQTLNIWDSDSSNYKPILEGAGNYYSIQKNNKGTYDLVYTTDL